MVFDVYGSLVLMDKVKDARHSLESQSSISEEEALRIFALAVLVERSAVRKALRDSFRESIVAAYGKADGEAADLLLHKAADEL